MQHSTAHSSGGIQHNTFMHHSADKHIRSQKTRMHRLWSANLEGKMACKSQKVSKKRHKLNDFHKRIQNLNLNLNQFQ